MDDTSVKEGSDNSVDNYTPDDDIPEDSMVHHSSEDDVICEDYVEHQYETQVGFPYKVSSLILYY